MRIDSDLKIFAYEKHQEMWRWLEEEANGRQLFPSMFLKFHFHSYFYAKEPWTTKETELYLPMQISPMYINPFHCFRFSDICFLPNSDKSQIFFLYRSFISLVLVHSPPDGHQVLIRCQDSQGKVVVQSLSCVWLFAIPWTTACQAFLSFTISPSLLKLMSIGEVRGRHMLWVYEWLCVWWGDRMWTYNMPEACVLWKWLDVNGKSYILYMLLW